MMFLMMSFTGTVIRLCLSTSGLSDKGEYRGLQMRDPIAIEGEEKISKCTSFIIKGPFNLCFIKSSEK